MGEETKGESVMQPSDLVRRATHTLMRQMEASNTDISAETKKQLTADAIPTLLGKQGTYKDHVIQRIIDTHDRIVTGAPINESDAGFLVLTHFNAIAEIQKLQQLADRLSAEIYRHSINRISLAGRC